MSLCVTKMKAELVTGYEHLAVCVVLGSLTSKQIQESSSQIISQ